MNDYLPLRSTLIGLAISIAILVANPAAAQKGKGKPGSGGSSPLVYYRVIPIENPMPDSFHMVYDLSNSGEAVGYIRAPEERIAFVWTAATGVYPLQLLLSPEDQQQWHLEIPFAINDDSGQIVGYASRQGGDPDSWAAFRLDLHEGARFTILEEGLSNGSSTIQISNGGDVVVARYDESILYYPPDFPATGKTELAYSGFPMGMNRHGEIIVDTLLGDVRLTLDSNGGYSEKFFPEGHDLRAINDSGMIAGFHRLGNSQYLFRYTDNSGEEILKDGRKTISSSLVGNSNSQMNDQGDIVLDGPSIHTADGRYLKLSALIHPDDAGTFPDAPYASAIAARNLSGLPPVIVNSYQGINPLRAHFLLYPESSGN